MEPHGAIYVPPRGPVGAHFLSGFCQDFVRILPESCARILLEICQDVVRILSGFYQEFGRIVTSILLGFCLHITRMLPDSY